MKKPKQVRTIRIDDNIYKAIVKKYGTFTNFINKSIAANIVVDAKIIKT